jgi:hypothetical protein
MKKILILSIASLLLYSCSNSENLNNNEPFIGVQLTSVQFSNGTSNNYTYNGNKLVKITNTTGDYQKFTYQGDLIQKAEYFNSANQISTIVEYTYNGNKVTKIKEFAVDGSYLKQSDFTYNNDNTINVIYILYNGLNVIDEGQYKDFIDAQGNRYKRQELPNGVITNYIYDNKNSPYKNITGYFPNMFEKNNVTQIVRYNNTVINTYQYNSENYPTSVTQSGLGTMPGSTIYNYQ